MLYISLSNKKCKVIITYLFNGYYFSVIEQAVILIAEKLALKEDGLHASEEIKLKFGTSYKYDRIFYQYVTPALIDDSGGRNYYSQ